ncbi:MAG: trypsin-like peptidase domain-containing protein, partial [Anaerolineales bacterium]
MRKRTLSLLILTVFAVLALSACGSVQTAKTLASTDQMPVASATAVPTEPATMPSATSAGGDLLSAYQGTLENIYTAVSPSVVNISVLQKVQASTSLFSQFPFFSLPQDQQPSEQYQSALGSGFVWDSNGDIVTNNHVVAGADKIQVTFSDGTTVSASLVGADPDSDLAVIKVDADQSMLHPVQMGDSKAIKVGQLAVAIGNPFGLEGTMTTGIISAVGRSLPSDQAAAQSYTIPDVIQTDAPINPGNSGGVLVDTQGLVLGVTAAIESTSGASAGIGFAIPASIVQNVVPSLITDGQYVYPWLGISGITLFPDLATAMNLDPNQRGAMVAEVMSNSPADEAGLRGSTETTTINGQSVSVGGDVITAIDDQPVVDMDGLIAYLVSSTEVGQTVTLQVLRDGKLQSIDVTLAARPTAEERTQTASATNNRGVHLGIVGMTVNDMVIQKMGLDANQQGVLVTEVD